MKLGILFEEKLHNCATGERNVVGRRLYNRLLQGGNGPGGSLRVHLPNSKNPDDVLQILTDVMTITRLSNQSTMKLVGSDGQPVTSGFGTLYEGITGDGHHVVVKIPKNFSTPQALKKWATEVDLAQKFGAANIGPRVFLASTQTKREFLVMEKFGTDLLEHLIDVLEQGDEKPENERAGFLKDEGARLRGIIDTLIGTIVDFDHPTTCFGDFRFENIVVDGNNARQIDFDFCYDVDENVDVRVLLQLAASFSQYIQNTNAMASVFPPVGRLFGTELWDKRKHVLNTLAHLKTMPAARFDILANKLFAPNWAPGGDFLNALQMYYRQRSQEKGESILGSWRSSPASVTELLLVDARDDVRDQQQSTIQ